MAVTYENIAIVYSGQKKYDQASEFFQVAMKIFDELENKAGIVHCYLNMGGLYAGKMNYSEAIKYYKLTLQLGEEIGNNNELAKAYIDMALVCFDRAKSESPENAMESYKEAFECLTKGLSFSQEIGNKKYIKQCYEGLIKVDSAQGNLSLALEHFRLYVLYKDSLLNENSQNQLALLNIQYETENKDKEIKLLNHENDLQALQVSKQKLQRNGAIISIAFLLVIGFLAFRSLHLRKKLEKQSAIMQERKRISADLHDDIGSGLSKISLLSEIVKEQVSSTETRREMEKIASTSRELLDRIREIIWALNSNNDYLENLVTYIRWYASDYFEHSGVSLKLDEPIDIPQTPISGEYRRNVFYSVKEAMHNILKHAEASEAEIKFKLEKGVFSICVNDNGKGIPEGKKNRFGNGIKNIMSRMEAVRGNVRIENHGGTKITLAMPV
jgi:signal transduction histidine kinase